MSEGLFRKAALDKMASPERLDELMRVTSPTGWLAVVTIGVVLASVVVWSIVGTIPTRVAGLGILAAGTYYFIEADAGGTLIELELAVGKLVAAGETVAIIDQPSLEEDQGRANQSYLQLQRDYESAAAGHYANSRGWGQQIATLKGLNLNDRAHITELESRLDQPAIYPPTKTKAQIMAIENQIASRDLQIQGLEASKRSSQQNLDALRRQVERAGADWEKLREATERSRQVKSSVNARVVSIEKEPGDNIARGDILARVLQGHEDGLQALFFIRSAQGADIKPGMIVEVSPANIKKEEFGFLKGEVIERSAEILTTAQVMREVGGTEERARQLLQGGAVYKVQAKLMRCATPTGYCWSSGSGPPGKLVDNQDINVNIITDSRAPYTYVIPRVRGMFGG
jgi:HlyD family secretion protein